MTLDSYPRHTPFEGIFNFRDLGGYGTRDGRTVVWRQLFRSGELQHMTGGDVTRLRGEIRLISVIDLRSINEVEDHGIGRVTETGLTHHIISFTGNPDSKKALEGFNSSSNMGEVYLRLFRRTEIGLRVAEALQIIADPGNRPLVFHCSGGKDRTGILSAVILSLLGVSDNDIIKDYALTAKYMSGLISRISKDPRRAPLFERLPGFAAEAPAESMALFLSGVRQEYGSIKSLMKTQGIQDDLIRRLKDTLLTD